MEIREIIRRWQAGLNQRRIARGTGLSRQTVRRYIEAAGLRPGGPEPGEEQLAALATLSSTRPRQAAVPSEQLLAPWAEPIDVWPSFTPPPPPGVDGIWLVTGQSLGGTRCTTANIGQMLERESFKVKGEFRSDAENVFRTGSLGVLPLLHFPLIYEEDLHTVTYHLDTNTVEFDGTLELNPYSWVFGDGEELTLEWGTPEGGEGEILPPGPHSNYSFYTPGIKHTYKYHGVFFAYVEIGKTIDGELSYDLAERHRLSTVSDSVSS